MTAYYPIETGSATRIECELERWVDLSVGQAPKALCVRDGWCWATIWTPQAGDGTTEIWVGAGSGGIAIWNGSAAIPSPNPVGARAGLVIDLSSPWVQDLYLLAKGGTALLRVYLSRTPRGYAGEPSSFTYTGGGKP